MSLAPLKPRIRAHLTGRAPSGNDIELPERQAYKDEHDANKDRPVGFERR
jgi:hypothetical protein